MSQEKIERLEKLRRLNELKQQKEARRGTLGKVVDWAAEEGVPLAQTIGIEGMGGTAGMMLGAPLGPAGMMVGGALGTGIGHYGDKLIKHFQGEEVDPSPLSGALPMAFGPFGAKAPASARSELSSALGTKSDEATASLRASEEAGIPASVGTVTTKPGVSKLQQHSGQLLGGVGPAGRYQGDIVTAAQQRIDDLATKAMSGKTTAADVAGSSIQEGAQKTLNKFNNRSEIAFNRLRNTPTGNVLQGIPVKTDNFRNSMITDMDKWGNLPNMSREFADPATRRHLDAVLADTGILDDAGKIVDFKDLTWAQMDSIRKTIGVKLSNPAVLVDAPPKKALKKMYSGILDDMEAALKATGDKQAIKEWQNARIFYRRSIAKMERTIEPLLKKGTPDEVLKLLENNLKGNVTKLRQMKANLPKEQWEVVQSYVTQKLGRASPGMQDATGELFSPAKFLTDWNKISPEARSVMFHGDVGKNLNALAKQMERIKAMGMVGNTSGTGYANAVWGTIENLAMGLVGGGLGYGAMGASGVAGAALPIVMNNGVQRLMTNPRFTKWLVTANNVTNPKQWGTALGQLGGLIAAEEADPYMKDAMQSIHDALSKSPRRTE